MSDVENSFLFVGLGNPGPRYAMTRHNMGYLALQALAEKRGWHFKEDKRFNALVVKGNIEEKTVHLLLPLTYMNLSGNSVRQYLEYFKLPTGALVVVTDDIALNFGDLRVREIGSAGGHNGLKSIQHSLGTTHYLRLRMGVGHPGGQELADYVLDPFTSDEKSKLDNFIGRGVEVLLRLLNEGAAQVMNSVNTVLKPVTAGKEPIDLTKPPLG